MQTNDAHPRAAAQGGKTMNALQVARLRPRFFIPSLSSVVTIIIVIGALALAFTPRAARAAGSAFVRVNQVGYANTATKRAYLMASSTETGATFSVKNAKGVTVYSAAIGANLGSWSSSYPDVYALDFGPVTMPGTYTISVSGPITGSSPSFPIGSAKQLYAGALSNALSYYQNERDGANFIPSPLRTAPGHLNDAHARLAAGARERCRRGPQQFCRDRGGRWHENLSGEWS